MTAGFAPQVTRYTGCSTVMSGARIFSYSPAPSRWTWRQKLRRIARCKGSVVRSRSRAVGFMQSYTACSNRFIRAPPFKPLKSLNDYSGRSGCVRVRAISAAVNVVFAAVVPGALVIVPMVRMVVVAFAGLDDATRSCKHDQPQQEATHNDAD